jgi:hypothetical protein
VGRSLKIVIALLVLFSVAAVCISPFVDLDPSALRSAQAALALALAIAGNAYLLCCVIRAQSEWVWPAPGPGRSPGTLLDLLCSLIC